MFEDWRSSTSEQELGRMICGQILTFEDKSTMNCFAIDSLNELARRQAGPGLKQNPKMNSGVTAKGAEDAKSMAHLLRKPQCGLGSR